MVERKSKVPRQTDPLNRIIRAGEMIYGPNFGKQFVKNIFDFPVPSDEELIMHFMRGGAGPIIRVKLYAELGVGWKLKPVGFSSVEEGEKARDLVEEEFRKRNFRQSMMLFATFYRVLGRAFLIKTYNRDGGFYFNKKEKCRGLDVINPMTIDYESIEKVANDTTGTEKYKQILDITQGNENTIELEQDRVYFVTNNELSYNESSASWTSDITPALTEYRALARFPHFREEMGALYSTLMLIITQDAEAIAQQDFGKKIKESITEAQNYLDETARFYRSMRGKGNIIANYSWETVNPISFAGKEVKLTDLEMQTVAMICLKSGVPMELLMLGRTTPNRSVMEIVSEIYIGMIKSGARDYVYTPIIEETALEILRMNNITEGHLEVDYNPFLAKNAFEMAQIISMIWPTGSISKPDVRDFMNWDSKLNLGGKEWEKYNPMPDPKGQAPMPRIGEQNNGPYIENRDTLKDLLFKSGDARII